MDPWPQDSNRGRTTVIPPFLLSPPPPPLLRSESSVQRPQPTGRALERERLPDPSISAGVLTSEHARNPDSRRLRLATRNAFASRNEERRPRQHHRRLIVTGTCSRWSRCTEALHWQLNARRLVQGSIQTPNELDLEPSTGTSPPSTNPPCQVPLSTSSFKSTSSSLSHSNTKNREPTRPLPNVRISLVDSGEKGADVSRPVEACGDFILETRRRCRCH